MIPSLSEILSEFQDKLTSPKTRTTGLIRLRSPRDLSLISLITTLACDGRTDGETDGIAMTIERCSIS